MSPTPPGKVDLRLSDGRVIRVSADEAARYDYYTENGKIMRREKVAPPPPPQAPPRPVAPPPTPRPAAPPQPRPPPRPAAPAPPAPPPPRPAAPPPRPAAPAHRRPAFRSPALGYHERVLIVTVVLALLLIAPPTQAIFQSYQPLIGELMDFNPSTYNQRSFPAVVTFNLTRTLNMDAPDSAISYNLRLQTPENIPGKQDILGLFPSPTPTSQSDKLWWNRTIPQGDSEAVTLRYWVRMTTYLWQLKESDVATTGQVPASYARYLDNEWKIAPTDVRVQGLADQIVGGETNYLKRLDLMYTWLLSHYTYQRSQTFEPKAPEETMINLGGDCDDFSVLFISMARYLGIPAWLELGLLYDDIRDEWGAHGWATVYIPLSNGTGVEATIDVVNRLFLIRDPYHFSDWSSDGDSAHLQDYYTLLTYQPVNSPVQNPRFVLDEQLTHDKFDMQGNVNYFHG